MKNRWTVFLLFILVFAVLFPCAASAEEEYELPDEFLRVVEELPREVDEHLPRGIHSSSAEEVAEAVATMSSGEYLLELIGETFGSQIKKKISLTAQPNNFGLI